MKPFYSEDGVTIYNADCKTIIPFLDEFDLLLTDPPYGLGKKLSRKWHGNNGRTKLADKHDWDSQTVSKWLIDQCLDKCNRACIWGGNFYELPPSRCWLIWDKLQPNRGSEMELCWTNFDAAPSIWKMSRIDAYHNKAMFKKAHVAEKHQSLLRWCIGKSKTTGTILDPFMGVGSSLVAAKLEGRTAVGIEVNKKYCEEAVRRLKSIPPST